MLKNQSLLNSPMSEMDEIQWQPINAASYLLALSVNKPVYVKHISCSAFSPHVCGDSGGGFRTKHKTSPLICVQCFTINISIM